MSRKRSRTIKLVLLGTASLFVGGCGGCDNKPDAQNVRNLPPNIDPVLAKKAVVAGTSVEVSDAFLQGVGLIASGPVGGLTAPLDLARLGYAVDQAEETEAVISNESGLVDPNKPAQPGTTVRHVYHYHSSPGIGWFLWGHMLGRYTASSPQPYVPQRNYGSTPRSYSSTGGSFVAGSSGGRSASPATGGGVSRGGFGSSGSAHASGGTS